MPPLDYSQGDAVDLFRRELEAYGLGSLADSAWEQWNRIPDGPFKKQQYAAWLYGTDAYKARFPYAEEKRRTGQFFNESAAIEYERQVRQVMHMAGVPKEMITQDYLNRLIKDDISFNEVQQDVLGGLAEYMAVPEVVKQEFRSQLGDDSAIIGFFIDPEQTQQRFQEIKAAAFVRGFGKRYGFNDLNRERASEYAYGMSAEQIRSGLAQADQFGALSRGTLSDNGTYGGDQLVEDVFSQRTGRIEKELEERAAQFSDGGGPATGAAVTGYGAARGA